MRFGIERICPLLIAVLLPFTFAAANNLREGVLRSAAKDAGLVPTADVMPQFSEQRSVAGRKLFESKKLSMSEEISCSSCHIDRFGSADGIPNGIGTRGQGEGSARVAHGGDTLPRNTLPLWGRGSKNFNVLFWDGRVERSDDHIVTSQFGDNPPSTDPLVVAAHLPMVEIKEMVMENRGRRHNPFTKSLKSVYARMPISHSLSRWRTVLIRRKS
jgi:cytochrome c peroxidase